MDSFYLLPRLPLHVSYLGSTFPLPFKVSRIPRVIEVGVTTQLGHSPNDLEGPPRGEKEKHRQGSLPYLAPNGKRRVEGLGERPLHCPVPSQSKGNDEDPPSEIQHQPPHGGKRTVSGATSL